VNRRALTQTSAHSDGIAPGSPCSSPHMGRTRRLPYPWAPHAHFQTWTCCSFVPSQRQMPYRWYRTLVWHFNPTASAIALSVNRGLRRSLCISWCRACTSSRFRLSIYLHSSIHPARAPHAPLGALRYLRALSDFTQLSRLAPGDSPLALGAVGVGHARGHIHPKKAKAALLSLSFTPADHCFQSASSSANVHRLTFGFVPFT